MIKKVIVFGTPTCSWCRKLNGYLKQNNIRFTYIDVSRNQSAAKDMIKKSGQQGVPQMWINGKPIIGFDKQKIDRMLNLKSSSRRG